jgi:hypothetical protein|uniref:Uncharacterized protein n=3 Tax=Enterobacteriaceae TaxID=543 RepID=A0A2L1KU66_ECOLX|nr:Hypothetical protein pT5282-CTXM_71 [Enterobacter cloacae]AVE17629.1 Hypothetical protein [Klebsiella pneumoniae]AVE17687.1 Hypothetical protein [Enterobacter cloacae]AVE26101.1 hypothetical protein [Escherichia coli]URZ94220.1 Hypothetical protein [Raoultella ornithinolytica]
MGCQQNFTTGNDGQLLFAGYCRPAAGGLIVFLLSEFVRHQLVSATRHVMRC